MSGASASGRQSGWQTFLQLFNLACVGALLAMLLLDRSPAQGWVYWVIVAAFWLLAWDLNASLSSGRNPLGNVAGWLAPLIFGATLLILWEAICVGASVPTVLLPAPSLIAAKVALSTATLWGDFVQTVIRAAIPGWVIGSAAGFVIALACDRFDFLRRGLIPIGNFVSALPMIGIAPILVMWFGFDWQSKAAVVVVMTFFPMLVNTLAGLASAGHLERDLMRSYGASWFRALMSLRLPAAMPFIFNALKINATLAMIGAIVAEFFGTPVVGMGFRISTEVGRMALDMVWATIAVAGLAGSAFYGLLVLIERAVTFWHPSMRTR